MQSSNSATVRKDYRGRCPNLQVSKMHIRTLGNTIIAVGVLIFVGSVFADGIGFGGSDGYGPGQITGLIFGPVICFIGLNVRNQADQDENSHS